MTVNNNLKTTLIIGIIAMMLVPGGIMIPSEATAANTTKTFDYKDITGGTSNALASDAGHGGVLARYGVKIVNLQ